MSSQSTGPRTDAGKARSALNAVKHGLCSERAVIAGEDPAEWEAFRDQIVQSHAPVSFLERELAERVALQMWRQRRAAAYEAELVGAVRDDGSDGDGLTPREQALFLMKALDKVVRYESHIARQLKDALQLLREAQANRAAAADTIEAPLPVEAPAATASSFRQSQAGDRLTRNVQAELPRPGVSFADLDLVPNTPAAKT